MCHCSVVNTSSGSTSLQHIFYIAENKGQLPASIACPRQLYGYDLKQHNSEEGHQLLLLGDFNSGCSELSK